MDTTRLLLPLKGYNAEKNPNKNYSEAKKPAISGWNTPDFGGMTYEEEQKWLNTGGWIGLKIPEDYIIVDIDDKTDGSMAVNLLESEGYTFALIETVRGYQIWFKDTQDVKQGSNNIIPLGIEVDYRVHGAGYVVLPTDNTEGRFWRRTLTEAGEIDELPFFLKPIASREGKLDFSYGSRNDTLHRNNCRLLTNGLNEEQVREVAHMINNYFFDHPVDAIILEDEVNATVNSAIDWFKKEGCKAISSSQNIKELPHVRIAKLLMQENYYIYNGQALFCYQDGYYRIVNENLLAKRVIQIEFNANSTLVNEVLKYLKSTVFVDPQNINPNDDWLNVRNGLLNFKTRELKPHTPDRYSTVQLPVVYNPAANSEMYSRFINSILDEEQIAIAEEMIGYCMQPSCFLETAFILVGGGSNGKSTFLDLAGSLFGKCRSEIGLHDIAANRFVGQGLVGKMVNFDRDMKNKTLSEFGYLKKLISGEQIMIEAKGKDPIYVNNSVKLISATNELPSVTDLSEGNLRRWIILDFQAKFEGKNKDPHLKDKLIKDEELKATFFNRALDGLARLYENGEFSKSQKSEARMTSWKYYNDSAIQFIDEMVVLGSGLVTERKEIFKAYDSYCKHYSLTPIGKIAFLERISNLSGVEIKVTHGVRNFEGISVINVVNF